MRRASLLLVLVVQASMVPALAAPSIEPASVIVVFDEAVTDPSRIAAEHAGLGADVERIYRHALKGYAARLSPGTLRAVAADRRVAYISPDTKVSIRDTQSGATWGLDRIDQRNLPLNSTYTYPATGTGVTAYIIDTGMRITHNDFGGRAAWGIDTVDGGTGDDCHGHGTHVGGTVGGTTYGVAKQVSLIVVRVLDCNGDGFTSDVIGGVDWVTGHHTGGPAVANMSLGGGANTALDNSVRNSIADGIVYAIAAGNGDILGRPYDACDDSPGRVAEAITIAASNSSDTRASWSNFGSCVDFFGPGVSITSAWYNSNSATNTISGTSMATPHVAGAAALYLQTNAGASPSAVRDALYASTTKNKISDGRSANNHLLFVEPSASIQLSRTSVSFPDQRVGTTGAAQSFTATNTGTTSATISAVTIAGAHAGDFSKTADTCNGASLSPGGSCSISVAFAPVASGLRSASVQISSTAPGSPHTVALSGTGTAPVLSVTPESLAFGSQGTGVTSTPRAAVIRNTGTASMTVGSVSLSGPSASHFAISADPCTGATIPAGGQCSVSVTFTPATNGAHSASLDVASDGGNRALPLTGTGVTPVPAGSLSPASSAFGDRPVSTLSAPRTVTLHSNGTAPLLVGTVSFSGPDAAAFSLTSDACTGATLAPGASCAVGVAFSPSVTGAHQADLHITSNSPDQPHLAALTGNGVPPAPEVKMQPPALNLSSHNVGTTSPASSVTVTNIGSAALVVGSLSLSGANASEFSLSSDSCSGASIAPGATCSFGARFSPVSHGPKAAQVLFPSNSTLGPSAAALSGTGLGSAAALSTGALAFGSRFVGSQGPAEVVRVTNAGNAAMQMGATSVTGANPSDFVRVEDLCSGAVVQAGSHCEVRVAFKPGAPGPRSATLSLPGSMPGPTPAVSMTGTGVGDTTPPVSSWVTPNLDVRVGGLTNVAGAATDDMSGIGSVTVTFVHTSGRPTVVPGVVGCSDEASTQCGFTAAVPLLPGTYTVNARSTDKVGNQEASGATITIVVV